MIKHFIFITLLTLFVAFNSHAEQCSAVFNDGAQNNSNSGVITFQNQAQIFNSPDNILPSQNSIIRGYGPPPTCDTGECVNSGSAASAVNYNNIPQSNRDINVGYQQTLSLAPGNYKNITLSSEASLNLSAGDYTFSGAFNSGYRSHIVAARNGVVRIFVKKAVNISNETEINLSGDSTNFLLVSDDDITVQYRAQVNGYLYSKKDLLLDNETRVTGAVSGKDVYLNFESVINFETAVPDFGDFCTGELPLIPLANYRFDECKYTGSGFEVIDQTGNYSATSHGGLDTSVNGKIELFAELSDENHHFETNIPLSSEFTVSTWFKKPTSTTDSRYFVLGAMQSGGDLLYIDRNNNWRWGVYSRTAGALNGSFSFASLDNNWHHMVLVYSGGQTQLFIDGVLEDTVNKVPSGTLKYIGASYDGINSNNPQAFRAPLDEFIVFDSPLSAQQVIELYNNQNAENNYDGSTRAAVNCLMAHYQFDEGIGQTTADASGNGRTGTLGASAVMDSTVPTWQCEANGYYLDFDGNNKQIVRTTAFSPPSEGTVAFWLKIPSALSSRQRVFGFGDGFELRWEADDIMYFDINKTGSNSSIRSSSAITQTDTWMHIAFVTSADKNTWALYINGVLDNSGSEPLSSQPASVLTLGGSTWQANNDHFTGSLEDFRLYSGMLTQSEIAILASTPPSGCDLIAYYEMDESVWSGNTGEVIDETGSHHGQAFGGATTDNATPAITGNPGTCGYGLFDGVNDYVEISDHPALDLATELTITTWIKPETIPSSGLKSILSKDENYEFHLNPAGEIFWWWGTNSFSTSGANITSGNWYHVSLTYKSGQQSIYINGVEKGSRNFTGNLPLNNDPLQIGQDQNYRGRYFHGYIDEVRIYTRALTSTDVNVIYQSTHPCTIYLDHFEINHDGQGLTCEPENIIIKACANSTCTTLNNDNNDVQLSINGTYNKTITVSGSTNTSFAYTNVGIASLSLNQTYECKNGASTSCEVNFADTGFKFSDDSLANPIPTQVSAKPSNILKVQAVETNPQTGACQAALINTTAIEMAATCVDPIACAGSQVAINNLNTTKDINTLNSSAPLTYTNVEMDFGNSATNVASFRLTYPDAGKVQLHARYNIPDENGMPSGNYMLGSSNHFVVRPFGFFIDVVGNPKAQNAGDTKFIAAGEAFTTRLFAVQWQSDNDVDLSDNAVTTNFGNEQNNETAKITPEMVLPNAATLPTAGILGSLSNANFTSFSNGISTNTDMTYSEVGIISFNAKLTDNSYLGAGDVTGELPYVGRFIPDHFELVKTDGVLAAYCDNNAVPADMPFTYVGQMNISSPAEGAIRYSLNPSFTITAKSKNAINTTENYTGDFMKLLGSSITRLIPVEDGTTDGNLGVGNKMALTASLNAITTSDLRNNETQGVITYTYHNDDNFFYNHEHNAERNKFTSDINLQIESVIDEDDVQALDADGDFDQGDPSNALDTILTLEPTGVEIRFGRAYLANSFGPETAPLPQELAVQYYDNNNYVLAEDDICSLYNSDNIDFDGINEVSLDKSNIPPVNGKFDDVLDMPDGITREIVLPAAGTGNQGEVQVTYDIYPWLRYDWTWDGVNAKTFDENPSAIATFGRFRGNDRIIYQREVNN